MPISYLDGNNQDIYAIKNIGSTFSDAFLNMAEARSKRQQWTQQNALNQAYFKLAQQKALQDQTKSQAEVENYKVNTQNEKLKGADLQDESKAGKSAGQLESFVSMAPQDAQRMMTDPANGPALAGVMRQFNGMPQGSVTLPIQDIQRMAKYALKGVMASRAMHSPAAAMQMMRPVNMQPGGFTSNPVLNEAPQQTPWGEMSPYQQDNLQATQQRAKSYQDYTTGRLGETEKHDRAMESIARNKQGSSKAESPIRALIQNSLKGGTNAPSQDPITVDVLKQASVGEVKNIKGKRFQKTKQGWIPLDSTPSQDDSDDTDSDNQPSIDDE